MKKLFCFRVRRIAFPLLVVAFTGFSTVGVAQAQSWEQEREGIRLNNEGVAFAKIGKRAEAIERYNRALALNPKSEVALSNRAKSYQVLKQFDKALQDANELVGRFPNSPEYLTLRGFTYFRMQKFEESRKDYQQALKLDPDNLKALEEYVRMLSDSPFRAEYEFEYLHYQGLKSEAGQTEKPPFFPSPPSWGTDFGWKLKANEIRLHGRVHSIAPKTGIVTVEVAGFGVPTGRFRAIGHPKLKQVKMGIAEIEWSNYGTFPPELLKRGDLLAFAGVDTKTGFLPRKILLIATDVLSLRERFDGEKFPDEVDKELQVTHDKSIEVADVFLDDGSEHGWPLTFFAQDEVGPVLFTAITNEHTYKSTALATARKVPSSIPWNQWEKERATLSTASVHLLQGSFSESHTLAVRLMNAPPAPAIPLAKERPKRGEVVWIAANYGGVKIQVTTTVLWSDSQRLVVLGTYGDEDGRQEGSPVLNAKGEIVGMVLELDADTAFAASVDVLRKVAKAPAITPAAKKP